MGPATPEGIELLPLHIEAVCIANGIAYVEPMEEKKSHAPALRCLSWVFLQEGVDGFGVWQC